MKNKELRLFGGEGGTCVLGDPPGSANVFQIFKRFKLCIDDFSSFSRKKSQMFKEFYTSRQWWTQDFTEVQPYRGALVPPDSPRTGISARFW